MTPPDCLLCRGACCEDFELPKADVNPPGGDERCWLELHAVVSEGWMRFECRCRALSEQGRCRIYSARPQVCRAYEPGGADCLDTLRRRRSPEQVRQIVGGGKGALREQ